jgi:hypothetical protein
LLIYYFVFINECIINKKRLNILIKKFSNKFKKYRIDNYIIFFKVMGIGDWGLGIGDWAQSPIPNPQSPIPK